jgi:hypothetical protein
LKKTTKWAFPWNWALGQPGYHEGPLIHSLVVGEKCCLPNNSLKKPKVNNASHNNFVHAIFFGKTNALSHQGNVAK